MKDIQPILEEKCIRCHKLEVWRPNDKPSDDGEAFSLLASPVHEAKSGRNWSESYLGLLQATMQKDGKRDTYHAKSNSFINWISPQSGPEVLVPYSFGAAKSPMLAMLKKGHGDTRLTAKEFEVLACWIDLAVPFCGDYTEANRWSEKEKDWYAGQVEKQRKLSALERRPRPVPSHLKPSSPSF